MDPSSGMHMPAVPPNSEVVHVTVGNPIIMYQTPPQAPNIAQIISQQVIPQDVTCQTIPHTIASQVQIASQLQASLHGHSQGRGQTQSHMQPQSHGQAQSHIQSQSHGQAQSHLQSQNHGQSQSHVQSQTHLPSQVHVPQGPSQNETVAASQDGARSSLQVPFAEVASLLDPNMKSSKARKYQILYEEVKRRLEPPEKMSLRSLAAYTRVSRGPASKKSLLESLNLFGLSPSTNTAVSSTFSKLTEGDTAALCKDLKDFALQYVDYENMAKQLLPETNQVQHWSKIIETRNYLEEMRKVFKDPINSHPFSNVTHGLGNGVMDVALDIIDTVIDRQIRILSGNTDPKPEPPVRRIRSATRKPKTAVEDGKPKEKAKRGRKKGKQIRLDTVDPQVPQSTDIESSVTDSGVCRIRDYIEWSQCHQHRFIIVQRLMDTESAVCMLSVDIQ